MFRNKSKINSSFILNFLLGLPWFFLAFLFIFNLIIELTGQVGDSSASDYGMTIVIGLYFDFLSIVFINRIVRAYRANRIGIYFEKYPDGLVPMEKLAADMKMKQYKLFKCFKSSVGKGLLINCSIFSEDPTFILLENGGKHIKDKFTIIHCNNCGAHNAVRIGFENTCKYCGSVYNVK